MSSSGSTDSVDDETNHAPRGIVVRWLRHGENFANLTRTFSYRLVDEELTPRGLEQAARVARLLATSPAPPEFLVTSPLRRARQTAEIVARALGLTVADQFEGLRELNVGLLDGRNDDDAWSTYESVLRHWRAGRLSARFPAGEDAVELAGRISDALACAVAAADDRRLLVVAHGANARAALPLLAGRPDPGSDLPTGGIARLRFGPGAGGSGYPGAAARFDLLRWGDEPIAGTGRSR